MPVNGFQTQPIPQGLLGLNLSTALDELSPLEWARASDVMHHGGGYLYVRPGMTALASLPAAANVHSIGRLNAQVGAIPYARIYGADAGLYIGQTDNVGAAISTGFSGNPLVFCAHHSEIGGDSWMFIGDSSKVAKVRIDGLVTGVGLAPPTVAATAIPQAANTRTIYEFESSAASNRYAGQALPGTSGAPVAPSITIVAGQSGNAWRINTAKGTTSGGYQQSADTPIGPVNLTTFGAVPSTVDDLIHVWIKVDAPKYLTELRIYLVTGTFTQGSFDYLPGQTSGANPNAFMKAFRASDITSVVTQQTVFIPAGSSAVSINDILSGAVEPEQQSVEINVSAGTWTEFGVFGAVLRKSDFTQIGNPDWSNVTGLVVWYQTNASQNLQIFLDNLYLTGGYSLDDSESGAQPYQWVYTHYDTRTHEESNQSPLMAANADGTIGVDVVRQQVTVTPAGGGAGFLRQRFYRSGGTAVDQFYFDGVNSGDGVPYTTNISDVTAKDTNLIAPDDNDRLVTTQDADGNAIYGQPLPVIFGPLNGCLLALGDPYRPGYIYNSKPGEPDHWPAGNATEVCPASEQLMNGVMNGTQAFAFSRERGYSIYPNLDVPGTVTALPSGFTKGLAGRWAIDIGLGTLWIVAKDGIYPTDGTSNQAPVSDHIRGLFFGRTYNGYLPIDFTAESALRIKEHGNDLYFGYQDTGGTKRWLVYSLLYKYWRQITWGYLVSTVYSELGAAGGLSLLLGELATGQVDIHSGVTDRGLAIHPTFRTGTLNQGAPRSPKQYAELTVDIDPGSNDTTFLARTDDETLDWPAVVLPGFSGRNQVPIEPFGSDVNSNPANYRARNVSFDVSASVSNGNWSVWLLELAYSIDPADYLAWQTDEIDHGISGWIQDFTADISYRALLAPVTMTVIRFNQDRVAIQTETYTLPANTAGKITTYVKFDRNLYCTAQYFFRSASRFRIYEDETTLTLQPLGKGGPVRVHPFTTEDSAGGGAANPLLAARRSGGAV